MSAFLSQLHKGKSSKPHDLVAKLEHLMEKLTSAGVSDRLQEDIGKYLAQMKTVLFGALDGSEPSKENAVLLGYEACKVGLPMQLCVKMPLLEFESRKDAAQVCGAIVRLDNDGDQPGVTYILQHPQILSTLFSG